MEQLIGLIAAGFGNWDGARGLIPYLAEYLSENGATVPVRCKDCRAYNKSGCCPGFGWCEAYGAGRTDEDFCQSGERREE